MSTLRLLCCVGLVAALASVESTTLVATAPAATTVVIAPLSVEEAVKWVFFSQVVPVKEKDSVLLDTMEAKNQIVLVHSITYFRAEGGQMYAVVNYLRPRVPPKP